MMAGLRQARGSRALELWRRPWPCVVGVAVVSLVLNFAVALKAGVPRPTVHDEFSYLLAADTFAHGRLTNPTHPLWQHFESIHIIQRPTYQSKYPPGQGLVLAAGQVATGYPIAGVWLSTALATAAACWMLLALVPAPWALFGGLLAAFHPLVLQWSQSYWGGSLAMLGGMLVIGGLERVIRHRQTGHALTMGAGIALLALCRPYEGFVLTVLVAGRLGIWLFAEPDRRTLSLRLVLLVGVIVAPTLAGLAFYNHRVTGHALKPPYLVYVEQYMSAPLFVWQKVGPKKVYRHDAMRAFHLGWERQSSRGQRSVAGFLRASRIKLLRIGSHYSLKGVLAILLVGLVWGLRADRGLRASVLVLLLFMAGLLLPRWAFPHYAAPAFGLYLLLLTVGARCLSARRWRGMRVGRAVVVALALFEAAACLRAAAIHVWTVPTLWTAKRERIVRQVRAAAPRSLVIVRYGPGKDVHEEWVYNEADIDAAPIVWARGMTPEDDQALLEYFRDRRAWMLEVVKKNVSLTPIESSPGPDHLSGQGAVR